jgi:hypothetical protein
VSPFELMLEALWIRHDDEQARRELDHYGGYLQLGYAFESLHPYYRFDFLGIEGGDPFFGTLAEDTLQHVLGVRWDLNTYVASKFELRRRDGDTEDANEAAAQLSFAF